MTQATLFLDLDGTQLTDEEKLLLQKTVIGGVILFGRNTENAEQVKSLIQEIRAVRQDLIISIDQEGGRVQRLKQGVCRLPAVQKLLPFYQTSAEQGLAAGKALGYLMAHEMRMLDVDISFAPVLDLDYQRNSVIADRAFGHDADTVIALSTAYIEGMRQAGMAATGKHFPGHGWTAADTHHDDAIDERSFTELADTDLKPFVAAIKNGLEAMMLAHVIYPQCAPEPAGFSKYWINDVLRQQLSYTGLIFSDDLCMQAAHSAGSVSDRAKAAIDAGCDILLCCNDRTASLELIEYMEQISCQPVPALAQLRGKKVEIDLSLLEQGKELAERLLEE